ncbi:MAG: isochorismatase family protein [Mucilaginibacter sp.]
MVTPIDKNTALVLIDLQKGIFQTPAAHPAEDILKNCAALVAAFRDAGLPIVVVNVVPAGLWTKTRKVAASLPAQYPEGWNEIVPEIKTRPNDIFITKPSWGAFNDTPLNDELQKRGVTGIVLAGISTSIGVEGTARQAVLHGYNLTFAIDAMTDRVMEAHNCSINYIFPRIGEVDTTANIIEKLEVRA